MTRLYVIAACTIALVVACDRVPLTSPTGSTISLSIDKSILPVNGQATVTAVVTEVSGTPVHNGTTVTFQTSLGRIDPVEALTVNGKAVATFLAGPASGAASIHAFSGGARTGSGNSSAGGVSVMIGTAGADRISVRSEPTNIPITGGTVFIAASLFDVSGNPIVNTPLVFSTDFGTLSSNSATTDGNGEARVQLTTNRTTTITVTAGSKTQTFTLNALNPPSVTLACTGSPNATAGVPVSCTITTAASGNASSSAPIQNVTVNWGDGTGEQPLGPLTGASTVSHTYNSPGSYTITAAATDQNSQRGTAVLTLNVTRTIPTISISGSTTSSTVGTAVSFTVTPPTNPAIPTANVTVDFGDGTSRNLGAAGAPQTVSKVYSSPGNYTVSATITDTVGTRNTASTAIQIFAAASPTVTLTHDSAPAQVGQVELFTVGASGGTGGISNIRVTLQDGTVLYSGGPGSFTWTPGSAGTATITAVATDGAGSQGNKIILVTVTP